MTSAMKRLSIIAVIASLGAALSACDLGASRGEGAGSQTGPGVDASSQSTPTATTAPAETPALTPAPRGRDGEFGKLPPGGAPPAAAPAPMPESMEQPAADDPGGEEKP